VTIQDIGGGKTRMSIVSEFPTVEAMEQMIAMGMDEGMTQAVGQIDAILAEMRQGPRRHSQVRHAVERPLNRRLKERELCRN
jgi:hypothetical protein